MNIESAPRKAILLDCQHNHIVSANNGFFVSYRSNSHFHSMDFDVVVLTQDYYGSIVETCVCKVQEVRISPRDILGGIKYALFFSEIISFKSPSGDLSRAIEGVKSGNIFTYDFDGFFASKGDDVIRNSSLETHPPLQIDDAVRLLSKTYGIDKDNINITLSNRRLARE